MLLLSTTTTFHYIYFRTFLSKGWEGGLNLISWQACQPRFASGVLGCLMEFVLSSFGTSLSPYCSDPTLCRLACTFRGLAWAPQVLRQRRVTFHWHIFVEALLDLDRQEGYYNYEDWPVDNDQQPEWLNNLDGGSSSSGESQYSEPLRLRPPYSAGM